MLRHFTQTLSTNIGSMMSQITHFTLLDSEHVKKKTPKKAWYPDAVDERYPPTPANARGSASGQRGCEHKNHPQQQQHQHQHQQQHNNNNKQQQTTTNNNNNQQQPTTTTNNNNNQQQQQGFRSYIREFLGAILMLFRPSLPWYFPIRELSFEQKE